MNNNDTATIIETCSFCDNTADVRDQFTDEPVCNPCQDEAPTCQNCYAQTNWVDDNRSLETLCPDCFIW